VAAEARRHAGLVPRLLGLVAVATAAAGYAGAQAQAPPPRAGLERLAAIVQRRLALTDQQAARLRVVSARYARDRQALVARERDARRVLREEVPRGDAADQERVQRALDALVAAQQRRAAVVAAEQRELSAFLSPVQRARYLGLQERAFRAAQRARGAREERAGDAGGTPAGPPGVRRGRIGGPGRE
jgi:hypothetical protein